MEGATKEMIATLYRLSEHRPEGTVLSSESWQVDEDDPNDWSRLLVGTYAPDGEPSFPWPDLVIDREGGLTIATTSDLSSWEAPWGETVYSQEALDALEVVYRLKGNA